jgi:hypothetical protein
VHIDNLSIEKLLSSRGLQRAEFDRCSALHQRKFIIALKPLPLVVV